MGAIELHTADLRPIVPEAQRLRVARAIARILKGSAIGDQLDENVWRSSLFRGMERLFDGIKLDFAPIRSKLREKFGSSEPELYVIAERVRMELEPLNITLRPLQWALTSGAQMRLNAQAVHQAAHAILSSRTEHLNQPKPTPIGETLVSYGVITKGQLEEALRMQQYFGGRLGTSLVELGMVTPDTLAHFLGVRLGMPSVEPQELENIPPEVLKLMSLELVLKYQAVPIALSKHKLRVAMIDPTDLSAVDAIAFATGHSVEAAVAPEKMIAVAMEKYYGLIVAPPVDAGEDDETIHDLVFEEDGEQEKLVLSDDRRTLMDPKADFGERGGWGR